MDCGEQEDEDIEEDEEEDGMEEEDKLEEEEDTDEEIGECVNEDDKPWNQMRYKCKHAVENSSRFSLRVMEAMRFLQKYENVLPISSVEDIVDYIEKNYNSDGDLNAQVRTALKQLCNHRFVVEVLKDEYELIGPLGSSAMLETCNCDVDDSISEIYTSTPKRTRLRKKLNEKFKKNLRCNCQKLDKNVSLSPTDSLTNTMFATPKNKAFRSLKDNSVKIRKHERSNYNNRNNHGNKYRKHTSKCIRKTNNDVAATSRSIEQYEKTNLAPNNQINKNPRDSIFQEIKNLFPARSKTREKELKKWIQRCRRECERQKRMSNK